MLKLLPRYCLLFFLFLLFFQINAWTQSAQCKAVLQNDTLTLENSKIKRCFLWNHGALQNISITNKTNNRIIGGNATVGKTDVYFPGIMDKGSNGVFIMYTIAGNAASKEYVAAAVGRRRSPEKY